MAFEMIIILKHTTREFSESCMMSTKQCFVDIIQLGDKFEPRDLVKKSIFTKFKNEIIGGIRNDNNSQTYDQRIF